MLIHLGNNEFVDLDHAEAIFNLSTIDSESRSRILEQLSAEARADARTAILCANGTWLASTISPESLAHRSDHHPFFQASFVDTERVGSFGRQSRGTTKE